ncbi:MAG: efflux RND transporter periplasmic adaptor subunit [Myxococcota bacterium]
MSLSASPFARVSSASAWHRLAAVAFLLLVLAACSATDAGEAPPNPVHVTTERAQFASYYERSRRFVGRVEFSQSSALGFELGGRLAVIDFEEGDAVQAGDPIARLDVERLQARRVELEAQLDEAQATLELAQLRDRRAQRLIREDVVSTQRADDARLERTARRAAMARVEAAIERIDLDLAKSTLRAPFSGRIARRFADVGEVVEAGAAVVELLEVGRPEVRIGVSRDVAAKLRPGDPFDLRVHGVRTAATVLTVLPERDRETRTVSVRFAIDTPTPGLREGDLADLDWRERVDAEGFWLPRAALTEGTRGLWAAYVANGANVTNGAIATDEGAPADGPAPTALSRIERRPVEILHELDRAVFVRGAIREGDQVVQTGVHRLVPGQLAHVVEREASRPPIHAAAHRETL